MKKITLLNKFTWLLPLLIPLSMNAESNSIVLKSRPEKTTLLELYTSEGCSSCPPAEKWLSGLKDSPRLWKDFVPVAFHVDYWDRLGWRDPWSDKGYSDRQQSYAESWHSENVYTPEFVLDGTEWSAWGLFRSGPGPSSLRAGVLTASSSEANKWQVVFEPVNTNGVGYQIHAALLENGVSSDVKAGENHGRKLIHDFAVAQFANVPMRRADGKWQGQFVFSVPSNRTIANAAVAIWITERDKLQSLQAVGGWIHQAVAGQ
jgi:hypothetical protein